jgi:hypothetical protein
MPVDTVLGELSEEEIELELFKCKEALGACRAGNR